MSDLSDTTLDVERKPSRWIWWLHPKVAIPLMLFCVLLFSPFLVRGFRIAQLPDIGEPFDVAALLKTAPPADDEVTKLLTESQKSYREPTSAESELIGIVNESGWAVTSEPLRSWLADNERSLLEWRHATELKVWPKSTKVETDPNAIVDSVRVQRDLVTLAKTQAECSLADGDTEAAWGWIQAMFRHVNHLAQHGDLMDRFVANGLAAMTFHSVQRFTESRRVTSGEMRKALDDLQQFHATLPPKSDAFRWDYARDLKNRIKLDDPHMIHWLENNPQTFDLSDVPASLRMKTLWLLGDPDFSDRAVKLVIRNWIEEADLPPFRRSAVLGTRVKIFDSVAVSSPISNQMLAQKVNERCLAKVYLSGGISAIKSMERIETRYTSIALATACQLYRMEHGEFPPKLSDLVPEILAHLPIDPFSKSGEALKYRNDGDVAVIYSLGQNLADDGGIIGFEIPEEDRDDGFRIQTPQ